MISNMEEDLLAWKFHFNICDAAHLALRNLLVRNGIPLDHAQREPTLEQTSSLWQTIHPVVPFEDRPLTATQGRFDWPAYREEDTELKINDVSKVHSHSNSTPKLTVQTDFPHQSEIYPTDRGAANQPGVSHPLLIEPLFDANFFGSDLQDSHAVPSNVAYESRINFSDRVHFQDRDYAQLILGIDSIGSVEESAPMSSYAEDSPAQNGTSSTVPSSGPSAHENAVDWPVLFDDVVERTASSKRKASIRLPVEHPAKKLRNNVACARCWISKRKVRTSTCNLEASTDGTSVKGQLMFVQIVRDPICQLGFVFESALLVQRSLTDVRPFRGW